MAGALFALCSLSMIGMDKEVRRYQEAAKVLHFSEKVPLALSKRKSAVLALDLHNLETASELCKNFEDQNKREISVSSDL
jgi:hypothetical protein